MAEDLRYWPSIGGIGLVNELTDADQRAILDHWSFPLHSVDVGLSGIDNRSELRDIQKRFHEM
jgi:hypothetical protein